MPDCAWPVRAGLSAASSFVWPARALASAAMAVVARHGRVASAIAVAVVGVAATLIRRKQECKIVYADAESVRDAVAEGED